MNRIKDLSKLKLKKNDVLLEGFKKESLIIKPGEESTFDYSRILQVGEDVDEFKVGDYVIAISLKVNAFKVGNRYISIVGKHGIDFAISPENFDLVKDEKNCNKIVQ